MSWMIEEYDTHWGGWRKVRASWDTEEPAKFPTEDEAEAVRRSMVAGRPQARLRVVHHD